MHGGDLGQALSAFQALSELVADDSRRVSELASDAVAAAGPTVSPAEVVLDAVDRTTPVVLLLGGPPLARAATVGASPNWSLPKWSRTGSRCARRRSHRMTRPQA